MARRCGDEEDAEAVRPDMPRIAIDTNGFLMSRPRGVVGARGAGCRVCRFRQAGACESSRRCGIGGSGISTARVATLSRRQACESGSTGTLLRGLPTTTLAGHHEASRRALTCLHDAHEIHPRGERATRPDAESVPPGGGRFRVRAGGRSRQVHCAARRGVRRAQGERQRHRGARRHEHAVFGHFGRPVPRVRERVAVHRIDRQARREVQQQRRCGAGRPLHGASESHRRGRSLHRTTRLPRSLNRSAPRGIACRQR